MSTAGLGSESTVTASPHGLLHRQAQCLMELKRVQRKAKATQAGGQLTKVSGKEGIHKFLKHNPGNWELIKRNLYNPPGFRYYTSLFEN